MDARSSRFASQFPRLLAVAAAGLFLVGCDVKVINRTPSTFSANPSGVYTITAEIKARPVVHASSLKPSVVIDGKNFPMQPSELGGKLWEFDYHLPPGQTEGAYYILVSYETGEGKNLRVGEAYTELSHFTVANRYSLSLDASRAPVGAQITVLGRGFTQSDVVYVGETPAQTIFKSANSLAFVVPPVAAGRNYGVSVGAPGTGLEVGTIRVDQGTLSVTPSSISVKSGQRAQLVFRLPTEAPAGGLLLDVTTDVPASVIMPEVTIPAGALSVNVVVQGGTPGSGMIFISAPGFGETTVPITVSGR
jgi:IPT/TIG domain